MLDKYRKSTHFSNAYDIIDCYIECKPEITFDEIVNHLSENYDSLLIRFIVGDRINKGGLYVCGNHIISKDKLNIYISRNIDKLNSDEVLSLMSSEINGPSRGLIMSKFKHQSRTEKKIRKIGHENMNKLCELIKGYLDEEEKEKEKEKKSKKREKCPGCGEYHSDEQDDSESSYEYSSSVRRDEDEDEDEYSYEDDETYEED